MSVERIRDAYASVAGLYIDMFGTSDKVPAGDLAMIVRHLRSPGGTVLDVGCGPGHLTAHLRSLGVDAIGIDLVPAFIAHAKAAHPDGDYRLGSMTGLGVPDGSAAGILSYYSLIHLPPPDLDDVLSEFRRVTAPGATLVAGFFDGGDEFAAFDHKVVTAYRWPVDEFAGHLARAGFTEVERRRQPADATTRALATIAAARHR
ncbi:class I SAM-dependent methyltransferase [Actinoplanes sp. NPDC023801]|uniref:class I SAM-dependent methyltransferase n=1 Tax=Actinoplanes sp. NPDC023801 TaxID=3154595 RepID=UPI0033C8EB54